MDEPRTPPLSTHAREKDGEGELELDLESLGLDDREIPPEKLTKLEKIGSGGFKDVFIGRFKGRRVAIAEFRGQLSQSALGSWPPGMRCGEALMLDVCSGHQGAEVAWGLRPSQHRSFRTYLSRHMSVRC